MKCIEFEFATMDRNDNGQNGQWIEWTMDRMDNGQNGQWIETTMDRMDNGQNGQWVECKWTMDRIRKSTEATLDRKPTVMFCLFDGLG